MSEADVQATTQAREAPAEPPAPGTLAPAGLMRAVPLLVTLIVVAVAGIGVWAMWQAYMAAPWTRDGTVRAYIVTMTPEVSGRIMALPVRDNQLVRAGDLLMTIDPTDYAIAVDLAQAAVDQATINADNAKREAERRAALTTLETSEEEEEFEETSEGGAASEEEDVEEGDRRMWEGTRDEGIVDPQTEGKRRRW